MGQIINGKQFSDKEIERFFELMVKGFDGKYLTDDETANLIQLIYKYNSKIIGNIIKKIN